MINGQRRWFSGPATWTQFPSEAGTITGFQTNAHSKSEWTVLLAAFGNQPGTFHCEDPRTGGVSISNGILSDGGIRQDETAYGTSVSTAQCTITLLTYGPNKGDHVTGTFTAELDISRGSSPVTHLSMTNGKFDLVQYADVP
ncbi:MAG: hypothetical protein JWM74_450 [Myxococcaceae bacterium]|nr:hypothetical protein [Myxococcaceae bacterium]